jgi:hypothetical protein
MRLAQTPVALQRGVVPIEGGNGVATQLVDVPDAIVGLGVRRIDFDGAMIMTERFVAPTGALQEDPEVVMRLRAVR